MALRDTRAGVVVTGPPVPGSDRVLTDDALAFIADLQRRFGDVASTSCIAGASAGRPRCQQYRA